MTEPMTPAEALDFGTLAHVNRERCESPDGFNHPINAWSLSDWVTAAVGEFGEAANKIKKLNRIRDGIVNKKGETEDELRDGISKEIADAVIYLDLLAQAAGINLGSAVIAKFNETSEEIGAPHRLTGTLTETPASVDAGVSELAALRKIERQARRAERAFAAFYAAADENTPTWDTLVGAMQKLRTLLAGSAKSDIR